MMMPTVNSVQPITIQIGSSDSSGEQQVTTLGDLETNRQHATVVRSSNARSAMFTAKFRYLTDTQRAARWG